MRWGPKRLPTTSSQKIHLVTIPLLFVVQRLQSHRYFLRRANVQTIIVLCVKGRHRTKTSVSFSATERLFAPLFSASVYTQTSSGETISVEATYSHTRTPQQTSHGEPGVRNWLSALCPFVVHRYIWWLMTIVVAPQRRASMWIWTVCSLSFVWWWCDLWRVNRILQNQGAHHHQQQPKQESNGEL